MCIFRHHASEPSRSVLLLCLQHAGTFIIPIFPPFTRGPGPAPALPGGFVWTWDYTPFPTPGRLSPIGYYLAGASGVPAA